MYVRKRCKRFVHPAVSISPQTTSVCKKHSTVGGGISAIHPCKSIWANTRGKLSCTISTERHLACIAVQLYVCIVVCISKPRIVYIVSVIVTCGSSVACEVATMNKNAPRTKTSILDIAHPDVFGICTRELMAVRGCTAGRVRININ